MGGLLIATVGPPGAGKTTWHREMADELGAVVVSLDDYRKRVSCCTANQAATPRAVEHATRAARQVLGRGGCVLWDATNAHRRDRLALLELAADTDADAAAVVFLPPLALAHARNAARSSWACGSCGHPQRVPHHAVTAMHREITRNLPQLPGEGWGLIHHHTTQHRKDAR